MSALSAAGLALSTQLYASIGTDTVVAALPERSQAEQSYAVVQTLSPSARLVYPGRAWRLSTEYTPQASLRLAPDPERVPLFLHRVGFLADRSRGRDTISLRANGVIGEVDFTTSADVFGFEQSTLPADPQIFVATTDVGIAYVRALTPRLSLRSTLSFMDQRPLQRSRAVAQFFRSASSVGIEEQLGYELTRRDQIAIATGPRVSVFEGATYLENRVSLAWNHLLSPNLTTSLGLGVGRSDLIAVDRSEVPPAVPLTREPTYFAIGSASIVRTRVDGSDGIELLADARPDPVLQGVRPQAMLNLNTTRGFAQGLLLDAAAGMATTANATPLPSDPNETSVYARFGVNFGIDRLSLRTGGSVQGRGPHLVRGLRIRERWLTGFIGLTWTLL